MKDTKYSYIDKKSVKNPKESAIATMCVLADKLKQLKNRQVNNDAINSENRMDYLYFFYMGQGSKVKNETATPDLNPKVMAVNEISSKVHILTK
jgi:hypothetical protein